MNSLKTLLIGALLAALAYAVYVGITGNSADPPTDDPAAAWHSPPLADPNSLVDGSPPVGVPGSLGAGSHAGHPPREGVATLGPGNPHAGAPRFDGQAGHADGNSGPAMSAPPLDAHDVAPEHDVVEDAPPVDSRYGVTTGEPYRADEHLHADHSDDVDHRPTGSEDFAAALADIEAGLEAGQLADAHYALSQWYGDPRLSASDDERLMELLNGVAGTVVYSRQHLLEQPYRVRAGETLEQIAEAYSVPWQLLARINGIRDPRALVAGEELKVVRGHFDALIRLDKRELTLVIQGRYAGRFRIGVDDEEPPQEGEYRVIAKDDRPDYRGVNYTSHDADAGHASGNMRLDLGNNVSIHGTSDPGSLDRDGAPGSIRLEPRDIDDVYNILTVGSKVIIQR